jgi:hypothetical protein
MRIAHQVAFINQCGRGSHVLGHKLNRAMHDGVADVTLARQGRIISRRPARMRAALELNQTGGAARLRLGRAQQVLQTIEHAKAPDSRDREIGAQRDARVDFE